MVRTSLAKGILDKIMSPSSPKHGWMDSSGIFWHPTGGNQAFGSLWIDRSMLDIVRPYGWRLLQYQAGHDMVEVGRSEATARKFMENQDECS